MQSTKQIEIIPWPSIEVQENFQFEAVTSGGNFIFQFKWLNDKWYLWVTLPTGEVRQASVYPNVISWSGFNDYGLMIQSSMESIDYSSLFLAEIYLLTWQ